MPSWEEGVEQAENGTSEHCMDGPWKREQREKRKLVEGAVRSWPQPPQGSQFCLSFYAQPGGAGQLRASQAEAEAGAAGKVTSD